MFAVGPHERQTASGYRRQAEEIRLLSEEQRGLSLHKFAISWRRCLKNCQSLLEWAGLPRIPGCEGSVLSFAQNLIGQGKPRERGVGLDPARRQPRWTQGCPAERPRPGSTMHCGPRHSERRVPAWQVRPGPAPPIPHFYPLGVARILPGRSPPCLPPATALGICRPTLGQESSPCRGGRSRVSLEARSSGGAGLLGLSPLQLFGSVGPRGRLLSLG